MHVLVWGNQQPEGLRCLPLDEQRAEIEEWFAAVAARYPKLDFVEVVNEPLHDPPEKDDEGGGNYLQALGGGGEAVGTGSSILPPGAQSFPALTLMINDYSITNTDADTTRYLEIIALLGKEKLVDAIGTRPFFRHHHGNTDDGAPRQPRSPCLDRPTDLRD